MIAVVIEGSVEGAADVGTAEVVFGELGLLNVG